MLVNPVNQTCAFNSLVWNSEGFIGLIDDDFNRGGHAGANIGVRIYELNPDHEIDNTQGGAANRRYLNHPAVVLLGQDGIEGQDDRLADLDQVDVNFGYADID